MTWIVTPEDLRRWRLLRAAVDDVLSQVQARGWASKASLMNIQTGVKRAMRAAYPTNHALDLQHMRSYLRQADLYAKGPEAERAGMTAGLQRLHAAATRILGIGGSPPPKPAAQARQVRMPYRDD